MALVAAVTASPYRYKRGIIHQEAEEKSSGDSLGASGFHHEVQHEHAKSHQSVKLEHFHPVPVYVKKEHSHLLKHPLEKGHSAHNLKQVHPKTEHHHGYGLVLEQHRYDTNEHGLSGGDHGFSEHSDDVSQIEHIPESQGYEGQGYEGQGYEGGDVHGWGDGSEQIESYQLKGVQSADGEQYQYSPIDLSHLGDQESAAEAY